MRLKSIACILLLATAAAVSAAGSDEEVAAAYKNGTGLIEPFLVLTDRASNDPRTPQAHAQILEGIRLLSTVVEARQDNWAAFWFIGKGHQALRDHPAAEKAFTRSYALNPTHRDVARELMIESICAGNANAAVAVAESIVKSHPNDAGLAANLGLAHLANGQVPQARIATERALQLAPSDKITRALLSEITSVQNGRSPSRYCPP
jgi:tetratricopeptide (TPR) repeat protein